MATGGCRLKNAMSGAMGRSSGSSRRTQGILGGRSEQVVRRVLDAAIVELARSGYHGFRMDVVAAGAAVAERRHEWRSMVTRGIDRGELPPRTDVQLVFDLVRAIVDSRRSSGRLDTSWLTLAVRTVIAGARAGTLVRAREARAR